MTLFFEHGSIFRSPAKILVSPVNCVGVMGAGLAREFKERFPAYFEDYKKACERKEIAIGSQLHTYQDQESRRILVSFPTKIHFSKPSDIAYIHVGLSKLEAVAAIYPRKAIALPALGCGLGGLNYDKVLACITEFSHRVTNNVYLYTFTKG